MHDGLRAGGCNLPSEMVCVGESCSPSEESVLAALQQTFGKPDRPTAIFATFDSIAEMIYLLLPQLGLRVPEDVSLIGEGGTWREGAIIRRLTSVTIDEVATGEKAISLLREMRCGERAIDDNEEFILPMDVYEGETLADPSAAIS